jgi:hypothetical protein
MLKFRNTAGVTLSKANRILRLKLRRFYWSLQEYFGEIPRDEGALSLLRWSVADFQQRPQEMDLG